MEEGAGFGNGRDELELLDGQSEVYSSKLGVDLRIRIVRALQPESKGREPDFESDVDEVRAEGNNKSESIGFQSSAKLAGCSF